MPGTMQTPIRKSQAESDTNSYQVAALTLCLASSSILLPESNPQSHLLIRLMEIFSMSPNRVKSKLLSKAKAGPCPPDQSLFLQLLCS